MVHPFGFDNDFSNKMANTVETESGGRWHPREQLGIHVFVSLKYLELFLDDCQTPQMQLLDITVMVLECTWIDYPSKSFFLATSLNL